MVINHNGSVFPNRSGVPGAVDASDLAGDKVRRKSHFLREGHEDCRLGNSIKIRLAYIDE